MPVARESPARLRSAVQNLFLNGVLPRGLEIGCGAFPAGRALAGLLPGWRWIALDLDARELRRAPRMALSLVQADAEHLPLSEKACFGLILVRHPDIFRRHAWGRVLPGLLPRLAPGGVLMITLYSPDEAEAVRSLRLTHALPLNEDGLAPAAADGRDRVVLAFQAAANSVDA